MPNAGMITPMDAGDQAGFVSTKKVGLGLGYFSIALGLVEIAAPGRLARWLGVDNDGARKTILAFGFRELLAGGALLRGPAVSTNVWNRVIGDVIDAGSLGLAATRSNRKTALAAAATLVGTAFVVDLLTARALDRKTGRTFPRTSRPGDRTGSDGGDGGDGSEEDLGFQIEPHDLAAA